MSSFFIGKNICIVGGSGVLGGEIARQLLSRGADVCVIARHPDHIAPDLQGLRSAQSDIRSRDSLQAAFNQMGGDFDGIVNACGVVAIGSIDSTPPEIVSELMNVNAVGTMNVLALGRDTVKDGGFIVSLTGVAADMNLVGMAGYCASKSAAHKMMTIAAREFRSKKITVLDVRAPHTETGLVDRALHGTAPKMPEGLDPVSVAARILLALENGESDLPAEAFTA